MERRSLIRRGEGERVVEPVNGIIEQVIRERNSELEGTGYFEKFRRAFVIVYQQLLDREFITSSEMIEDVAVKTLMAIKGDDRTPLNADQARGSIRARRAAAKIQARFQRQVLFLSLEGLPDEMIADRLGKAERAVRRARLDGFNRIAREPETKAQYRPNRLGLIDFFMEQDPYWISELIKRLPKTQAAVFKAYCLEGKPKDQIAREREVSENDIKHVIEHARTSLLLLMEDPDIFIRASRALKIELMKEELGDKTFARYVGMIHGDKTRSAVRLVHVSGLSPEEAAETLGVTVTAIRRALQRGETELLAFFSDTKASTEMPVPPERESIRLIQNEDPLWLMQAIEEIPQDKDRQAARLGNGNQNNTAEIARVMQLDVRAASTYLLKGYRFIVREWQQHQRGLPLTRRTRTAAEVVRQAAQHDHDWLDGMLATLPPAQQRIMRAVDIQGSAVDTAMAEDPSPNKRAIQLNLSRGRRKIAAAYREHLKENIRARFPDRAGLTEAELLEAVGIFSTTDVCTVAGLEHLAMPTIIHATELNTPPSGEGAIEPGSGAGIEFLEIPKSRFLIELLTQLGYGYELFPGRADKEWLRQSPYHFFFLPNKQVAIAICNATHNATWVCTHVNRADVIELQKATKPELNAQPHAVRIIFDKPLDTWKKAIAYAIETGEVMIPVESRPKKEGNPIRRSRSSTSVERTLAPVGWKSLNQMAAQFGLNNDTLLKYLPQVAGRHHLDYEANTGQFDPVVKGHRGLFISAEFIAALEAEHQVWEKNHKPPLRWKTLFGFISPYPEIMKRHHTVTMFARELEQRLPDEHKDCQAVFLSPRTNRFYSPIFLQQLAQEIRAWRLRRRYLIETGWKTASMIAEVCGQSRRMIAEKAESFTQGDPSSYEYCRGDNGTEKFFRPDIVAKLEKNE